MPIRYMNGVSYIFTQEGEIALLTTTNIKIYKNYFGEFI